MVQFSKLRLSGFKSFVEPTELLIEPGLTGVIGPNGCGKSNLVEALRWAMGETSPKSMRGTGMEDVIFSGTGNRPARNMAEVVIALDNADRKAPAAFNGADDLEISRRIERGAGSAYRINGGDVRARDVQLLFADASTGAHSPALVSQGRIGNLISAKPKDRRAILEEAAGITGLHSRRHEAELRLRGAENNLTRLDDVMGQLEGQLQSLKRQARQATRYRNLQGHVRKAEALTLHIKWAEAKDAVAKAQEQLKDAEARVTETAEKSSQASRAQADAGLVLPALRKAEAECAAALHRLAVERDSLEAEEARARSEMEAIEARLLQTQDDLTRAEAQGKDAATNLTRLDGERETLEAAAHASAGKLDEAAQVMADLQAQVREQDEVLRNLTEKAASLNARRSGLEREIREAEQRLERIEGQITSMAEEKARLEQEIADDAGVAAAAAALAEAEQAASDAIKAAEEAEASLARSQDEDHRLNEAFREAGQLASKLRAEETALANLLAADENDMWPPVLEQVEVEPGYEAALGIALGDDLSAPIDDASPVHWSGLDPYDAPQPLPDGAKPLINFVRAPAPLHRRLSQVGIVDADQGAALRHQLKPGQRLVSKKGDLWRWDGFTAAADAPTPAARRLEQKNRLTEITAEREIAEQAAANDKAAFEKAHEALLAARTKEGDCRRARRAADDRLATARKTLAEAEKTITAHQSRLAALEESSTRLKADHEETGERLSLAKQAHGNLDPQEALEQEIAGQRGKLDGLRADLAEAMRHHDGLKRDAEARTARLAAIAREHEEWDRRAQGAQGQITSLAERKTDTENTLAALKDRPAEIAAKRDALLGKIAEAEAARNKAADELQVAEDVLKAADDAVKATGEVLAAAREDRARISASLEGAETRVQDAGGRIREVMEVEPHKALEIAELDEGAELPPLAETEQKLERLKAERERLGAVNLRAEEEARELTEQQEGMQAEREELEQAIAKLRASIGSLNRQGRERLMEAFTSVNEKFSDLFTDLFGGGSAHLEFIESDDPLEAGLEIFASPPGKKLQVMTLLSGGEQALTALALIFAVFLTNPSPICVLDEVDAPLDDANVDRFCSMVERIGEETGTRFLIITHHAVTMARMHRLFGVTMAERGVSQLVSVDLQRAEELVAAE